MADSKKRVAGTQLTRENPDPDESESEPETGSFRKATEEVMAQRRIVKVKRSKPQQQTPNPANPFAAICLAPPPPPIENAEKDEETSQKIVEKVEIGENVNGKDDSVAQVGEKSEKDEEEKQSSEKEEKTGNGGEEEKPVPVPVPVPEPVPVPTASLSSFGQLSSGQNAFSGLASTGTGTGFSTGSDSFPAFSNSVPMFGSKPDSTLKEVQVETGEENERAVFSSDAVLFEFLEGGWKERGKGEVKLNVPVKAEGNNKGRLVMRTKGNYRLVLNANLYADMSLKDMDKRGVTFACLNSGGELGLGLGLSTFALKFRDGGIRDEFRGVVLAHKGDKEDENENDEVSNAPENSPKEPEV